MADRMLALWDALRGTTYAGHCLNTQDSIYFNRYEITAGLTGYIIRAPYFGIDDIHCDSVSEAMAHIRAAVSYVIRMDNESSREINLALAILHDLIWYPFLVTMVTPGWSISILIGNKVFTYNMLEILDRTVDLTSIYAHLRAIEEFIGPARLPAGLLPYPIAEEIVYWGRE